MARLWQSGFELNSLAVENFSAIVSHMSLVTTGSPRSGTYHAEATGFASGAAQGDAYQFVSAAGNGPYFFKFAFKYATAPSADNVIFRVTNALSSGTVAAVKLTSAGQLKLWQGSTGGSQVGSNSATLTANTYYEIEVKFNKTGAGTDTLEARLNGTVFATASNLTLANPILAANYGGNLFVETQTTGDWFFDDLAINDSTGSFQTGYPGSEKIIHLLPNAAGDVNTFATQTGGTAGSTNNFTRVNEVTPDDATTFNGSSVLNQEDLFNVANSDIGASDTVNVVMVGGRFRNNTADATTAFKFEIEKAAAGTITQSAAIIPNSVTWQTNAKVAPFNYPLVTYQDPSSANWTQTTLDSMQVGYKLTAANVNRVDISTVWASVAYTPKVSVSITQVAANVTATGGTQTVVSVSSAAIAQSAATVTTSGGTQSITTVNNVSLAQVAAVVTASGGTQSIATVNNVAITQVSGNVIASGGTQSIATVNIVAISQVAATITATGGTQTIATINNVSISQLAATVTAGGGTQAVTAGSVVSASISQVGATITVTGGTQTIAIINNVSIAQIAGVITANGGIQAVATVNNAVIAQRAASLLVTSGLNTVILPPDYVPYDFILSSLTNQAVENNISNIANLVGSDTLSNESSPTNQGSANSDSNLVTVQSNTNSETLEG